MLVRFLGGGGRTERVFFLLSQVAKKRVVWMLSRGFLLIMRVFSGAVAVLERLHSLCYRTVSSGNWSKFGFYRLFENVLNLTGKDNERTTKESAYAINRKK